MNFAFFFRCFLIHCIPRQSHTSGKITIIVFCIFCAKSEYIHHHLLTPFALGLAAFLTSIAATLNPSLSSTSLHLASLCRPTASNSNSAATAHAASAPSLPHPLYPNLSSSPLDNPPHLDIHRLRLSPFSSSSPSLSQLLLHPSSSPQQPPPTIIPPRDIFEAGVVFF